MKKYIYLKNTLLCFAFLMSVLIMLKAGSWELGLISFNELGKITTIYMILCFIFIGSACLCDKMYKIQLYKQRKERMEKRMSEISKNHTELINMVKKPMFHTDKKDKNTA